MKRLAAISLAIGLATPLGVANSLESANVTKVINDVRIYRPDRAARKASPGDLVHGRTSLQTGRRSRSELRFQDQTLTRLGANSVFSFEEGSRDLSLTQGTLLLQVPRNAGGARINTPTVTASVTGTTIMLEYFAKKWMKAIVLEGSLDLFPNENRRDKVTVRAGEMAVFRANDRKLPKPVKVDLRRLMKTSGLVDPETFGPLPNHALDKIREAIEHQDTLKRDGFLTRVPAERDINRSPAKDGTPRGRDIVSDQIFVRRQANDTSAGGNDPGGDTGGGDTGGGDTGGGDTGGGDTGGGDTGGGDIGGGDPGGGDDRQKKQKFKRRS
ncbi:MAG: FecR domain-containing protein [Akkermansiaceae bacterium]|nr:FecR domain-containing protein [Akkermansiaceae bacterium]